MSRSVIYNMFTSLAYTGQFEYPQNSRNIYTGEYTPMVTADEFDRVQTLLGKRGKSRQHKHNNAFTGELIDCGECGSAVTADVKNKLFVLVVKTSSPFYIKLIVQNVVLMLVTWFLQQ